MAELITPSTLHRHDALVNPYAEIAMTSNLRRLQDRKGLFLLILPVFVAVGLLAMSQSVLLASPPGTPILPQEQEVVDLVNAERAKVGRAPLIVNYSLMEAAWSHNEFMVRTGAFCHNGCGDGTVQERIGKTGYQWSTFGENIARGQRSPVAVMNAWMNSTGHRRNILNDNFKDIGVAYNPSGPTWTQVFGAPRPDYQTVTPPGSGPAPTPEPCSLASDVNGDEKVDQSDVAVVSGHFLMRRGDEGWNPAMDVVVDGVVNIYDIFQVVTDKGASCP